MANSLGCVVGGEPSGVGPRAEALERDDRVGDRIEELAVVGDHEDRLGRGPDGLFEPTLAGQVEEVVGFVEEQDLDVGGQQRFEHEPLALTARQLRDRSIARLVECLAQHAGTARVPARLLEVPIDLAPFADRFGELDTAALAVVAVVRRFRLGEPASGLADPRRRERREQRTHGGGAVVGDTDRLRHAPQRPVDAHRPLTRSELARDHLEHRRLSDAVRAHECRVATGRHTKAHVREQLVAARVGVRDPVDIDRGHRVTLPTTSSDPGRVHAARTW